MESSIKEVYKVAKEELSHLIDIENSDYRLEQIEFNKQEQVWLVVISYLIPNNNKSPLLIQSLPFERIYKKLKINEAMEVTGLYMFNEAG